jgi:hypothetical protein
MIPPGNDTGSSKNGGKNQEKAINISDLFLVIREEYLSGYKTAIYLSRLIMASVYMHVE